MDGKIEQDHIDQNVTISDQGQVRGITQIGKIIQIIRHPAAWQDAIWAFLSNNRGFVVAIFVLEVGLLSAYLPFRNLYLIPWWRWALAAVLLIAAAWSWYRWGWLKRARWALLNALMFTCALLGLLGWQTWRIAFPERFAPQAFGIAIAELGGENYRNTARARDISNQVYEHLCAEIKREFGEKGGEDPCAPAGDGASAKRVVLQRIGIIQSSRTAQTYGERIGADVVIWGQVIESKNEATVSFHVRETLDRAVSPEYPLVLPVTLASPEIFAHELNSESSPITLKDEVAQQSTIISSFALGLAAYLERDFPKAVTRFETAANTIDANPMLGISSEGKGLLYFYLGNAKYAQGHIEDGQVWLKRAQIASPQEPAVPLSLALGYGSLGKSQERDANLQQALDLIKTWLETHPDNNAAIYDRGAIYQIQDQQEYAITDFEEVIRRDPNYYVAYINLGQANAQLKQFDRAEQSLRNAIELAMKTGTNASWAHLNLAMVYQGSAKPELARTEFQEAIKLDPDIDWMYYYYAQFLEDQEEIDAALDADQKMIEVTQNKAWAYRKTADLLKRHGLLKEALQDYKRAIQSQSDDPLTHTYLAETYFALGDTDNARREFEQAIKQNGTIPYVYASYAWALSQLRDFARAAEMYEKSLALQPRDWMSLLYLGQTYEKLGEYDKAKERYRQILRIGSQLPEPAVQAARDRLRALGVENPQP